MKNLDFREKNNDVTSVRVSGSGALITGAGVLATGNPTKTTWGSHVVESYCGTFYAIDIERATGLKEPAIDNFPVPISKGLLNQALELAKNVGRKYSGDPKFLENGYSNDICNCYIWGKVCGSSTLPYVRATTGNDRAIDAIGVMTRKQFERAFYGGEKLFAAGAYASGDQMLDLAYDAESDTFDPRLIDWSNHAYGDDCPTLSELGLIIVIEPNLRFSIKLRGRDYWPMGV